MTNSLHVSSIIILCVLASPALVAVLIPLAFVAKHLFRRFRAVSRDLKRLESSSRSPIYASFSETLAGLDTIRAFWAEVVWGTDSKPSVYVVLIPRSACLLNHAPAKKSANPTAC